MSEPLLALAIPTYNRGEMLEAILRELLPTAQELGVALYVSDNCSADDTAARLRGVRARHALLAYQRQASEVPIHENVMAAMLLSDATYTWWSGDDDFIHPDALRRVCDWLVRERPTAVLFPTVEVDPGFALDPARPIAAQIPPLNDDSGFRVQTDAASLFREHFYEPQLGSFILRTADVKAADYERYFPTMHPHLGAFYDALADEQRRAGEVRVLEALAAPGCSLTRVGDRHKTWGHLRQHLAREAMPRWIDLLPECYAPHREAARAFHRHIFRDILDP
jgi:glycosyltransferase involved in cell wall biosynthesis